MGSETSAVQPVSNAALRWRRVALAAGLGLVTLAAAAWMVTGAQFQLWFWERQSTSQLEQAARHHPDWAWPGYVLGTRYAEQDRLETAMDQFERARNLEPNDFRPHLSLGLGFLRLGAPEAAIPELSRAAELAPKEDRVLRYLGLAFRQVNRYRDAVIAGETSVKLNARSAENWYQLGLTYYRPTGQQGKGRDCLKRAVELEPSKAEYRRDYASAFSDVGDYDQAAFHAREAVRLDPNDPVSRYLLGKIIHRSQSAPAEAAAMLREAIRLSPGTFQPHYELGVLLEEQGDFAGALAEFETSSQINAHHEQSWFHQANAASHLGRTAQAAAARRQFQVLTRDRDERQYLERRIFDHPDDATLRLRFAGLLERNGNLEAAAEQCQAILRKNPKHPQARELLARLARKAGVTDAGKPAQP